MDVDEDYSPSSGGSSGGAMEVETRGGVVRGVAQSSHVHETTLPIRPATSGSENQQSESVQMSTAAVKASRKRRRSTQSTQGPSPTLPLPFKRVKGILNPEYIKLLNQDIQDTATGMTAADEPALESSVLGAVQWSPAEKEALFHALSRLGRDDLGGIASRIGTKNEMQIQHYIALLEHSERARRFDEDKRQRNLTPASIPAAIEISQDVCNALEEAADDVALRQEHHEDMLEQKRWKGQWLITPAHAKALDMQIARGQKVTLPFAELFHVGQWLKLSDRIFMNSIVQDCNWRMVSEEAPSIRATGFEDFHGLVHSITRRLVSATLFVANSRISAKRAGDRRTRGIIRAKDVRAAVASLGMKENSRDFWARSARRLRLDVHSDGPVDNDQEEEDDAGSESGFETVDDDVSDSGDENIMSYDEVEAALGDTQPSTAGKQEKPQYDDLPKVSDMSEDDEDDDSAEEEASENTGTAEHYTVPEIDRNEVDRDLYEAITYSDIPYNGSARAREAIRRRIEAEYLLEADADRLDATAGAEEETRLLALLRTGGTGGGGTKKAATPSKGETPRKAGLDTMPQNWRDNLVFYNEWETTGDF